MTEETSLRLKLPLVPLNTVLFPDGPLPLRIFEPRYLDMISQCMKDESPFGICLISEGDEVGASAVPHEIGTIARIQDWHMRHDGILGITVIGDQRFKIISSKIQTDQLAIAEVELLDAELPEDVPVDYLALVDLLKEFIGQIPHRYENITKRYGDASWVGYRLSELLPLKISQKQYFLQLDDPIQRLERLSAVLEHLDIHV